jgi:hypothetical protein
LVSPRMGTSGRDEITTWCGLSIPNRPFSTPC